MAPDPAQEMAQVYDLARDREYIERVQAATVEGSEFALSREDGLFGSRSWWEAIQSGAIPTRRVEGVITRVFENDRGWPEFELAGAEEASVWSLDGDAKAYRPGRRARVDYVVQSYRSAPPEGDGTTRVVLAIWVER